MIVAGVRLDTSAVNLDVVDLSYCQSLSTLPSRHRAEHGRAQRPVVAASGTSLDSLGASRSISLICNPLSDSVRVLVQPRLHGVRLTHVFSR